MEKRQQDIKDYFSRNLKAEAYMNQNLRKDAPEMFRFLAMFIHDAFRSGRFQGSKLLEIGSGATVHNIATASFYFDHIVLSDYVENNVEELKKWLKGQSSIKQLLDVQAGLEGYGYDLATGERMIESRIRKKVKRVIRCDLLVDGILLEEDSNPETSPPFDMVISCLCLEVAPVDIRGYAAIMKRINTLLRPGGGLLLVGFLEGGLWTIGKHNFHQLKIKENDLLDALADAGFGNIEIKTKGKEEFKEAEFEYDKLYGLVAEKL